MGKSVQKIGIIGAGNLGTSIALSLSKVGYSISFFSSHYNNEMKNIKNIKNIDKFVSQSDIIFIAVKDKAIKDKVKILKNFNLKDKIIIHFSGFYSSDLLSDLKNKGAFIGSFHPIISFPTKYLDILEMAEKSDLPASFEGDDRCKTIITDVFEKLGFKIFKIDDNDKALYHLSLSLISNHPFYMVELGKKLFQNIKLDIDKDNVLNDFLKISVDNYIKTKKISGPLSRGDMKIITDEINFVKDSKIKDILNDIIKISQKIKEEV